VPVQDGAKSVSVKVVTRSTLAFARREGHRFTVGLAGGRAEVVNFNSRLNEDQENIYSVYYPTVVRRVVESRVRLDLPSRHGAHVEIEVSPLDPGIAFEQIVVAQD